MSEWPNGNIAAPQPTAVLDELASELKQIAEGGLPGVVPSPSAEMMLWAEGWLLTLVSSGDA